MDAGTGDITRLFNPRSDLWRDHFRYDGTTLVGLTSVGRCTVAVLAINVPERIAVRQSLSATASRSE